MKLNKVVLTLFTLTLGLNLHAQIVINGYNPRRVRADGPTQAISVSYGSLYWVDGKNVPLSGFSTPRQMFHNPTNPYQENKNQSTGITVGYEKSLSPKLALRAAFSTAKLTTGIKNRADLLTSDKSKITQLGIYSRYRLTKELSRRLQFQWVAGPELIYVKKDILVQSYVDQSGNTSNYYQDISITEGAVVTGLGISLRVSKAFSLFSDGLLGVSLPGGGVKITNSGFGLKYNW